MTTFTHTPTDGSFATVRSAAVLIDTARRRGIPVILITDMLTVSEVDLLVSCPRGLPGESSSHAVTALLFDALARLAGV